MNQFDPSQPVLVGCAHGTGSPAGRRAMAQLRLDIADAAPGVRVVAASVDVQRPRLTEVVDREVSAGRPVVIVPLLLSSGYHVAVDIAEAVQRGLDAGGQVRAATALGPDPCLTDVLLERLAESDQGQPRDRTTEDDVAPGRQIVLVAAGSSDPGAVDDVSAVAADLSQRLDRPVTVAFLSAAIPRIDQVLPQLAADGPVTVACHLLAPGFFDTRLRKLAQACGDVSVTAPLAPHPRLAELALRRYLNTLDPAGSGD